MSLTTVVVSVYATLTTGENLANGRVRLMLTSADVDGSVIAPTPIDALLDNNGFVNVNLWPNARGTQNSQYLASFYDSNGRHAMDVIATIPASNCNLHDHLATLVTDPGMTSLATSTGSSLIGFIQSGTGAVARTAQDKHRDIVSAFDFMSSAQKADVRAGTALLDVGAAVQAAVDSLPSTGGKVVFPQGTYLMESLISDPYDGTTKQHSVLISGKSNIVIDARGAVLKQTSASTGASNGGIITFDTCTNCKVYASGQGWTQNISSSTVSSAALVAVIGACNGIEVNGEMTVGGRALCLVRSQIYPGAGLTPGPAPSNVRVSGYASGVLRGVLSGGLVANLSFDVQVQGVARAAYIYGGRNIRGTIKGDNCYLAGVYLSAGDVGLQEVECNINLTRCNAPVRIDAENNNPAAAASLSGVKVYGIADNEGFQGVAMVTIDGLTNSGTTIKSVDLSGLIMRNHGGSAGVGRIVHSAGATIDNFKWPQVIQLNNVVAANLFDFDNTVNSVFKNFSFSDMYSQYSGASYQFVKIAGGNGVVGVSLSNRKCVKTSANSGYDVDIQAGSGVDVSGLSGTTNIASSVTTASSTAGILPIADDLYDIGSASFRMRGAYSEKVYIGAGATFITSGAGTPEGAVTAPIGSLFTRSDGGASTTLYVKESGTGNTGWIAK
jgi:hypothetical protein